MKLEFLFFETLGVAITLPFFGSTAMVQTKVLNP